MAIEYESGCVDCGFPCIGNACRHYKVKHYYCDHKDEYIEELEAEIEQYMTIGTVEERREAMEKQRGG